MTLVVFRTDTTDMFGEGKQPRMMRLEARLYSSKWDLVGSIDTLIRPDGWVANAGAAAVHGITVRQCEIHGIRCTAALGVFMDMVRSAKEVATWSWDFHAGIVDVELNVIRAKPEAWKRGGVVRTCIMRRAAEKWNGGRVIKIEAAVAALPIVNWSGNKMDASVAILRGLRNGG